MYDREKTSVAICTLGCRVNQYESRAISEYLEERGVIIKPFTEKCDAYIINTCAVTAESEKKGRKMINRAHKLSPDAPIIVTGCQSQLHPEGVAAIPGVKYVSGNASKLDAARAVFETVDKEIPEPIFGRLDTTSEYESYSVKKPDHTRAYIKIEDGCENRCAYCVIPKVRGPVRSKLPKDVINEAEHVAELGYKEIVLTGIETCSYQYNLTELMRSLSDIDGIERIRLSSVNPAFINQKFADSIKDIKKICPHFHLSLQSCCTKTLNAMRRRYNTDMLMRNCEAVREAIPNVMFTADIICGFPGETEEDFNTTLENVKKLSLLSAHVFPYSKRPGTEAAEMPMQVDEKVKAERCEKISAAVEESRRNIIEDLVKSGKEFSVLFETYSSGYLYGHTESFIRVKAEGKKCLTEQICKVRLIGLDESAKEPTATAVILSN